MSSLQPSFVPPTPLALAPPRSRSSRSVRSRPRAPTAVLQAAARPPSPPPARRSTRKPRTADSGSGSAVPELSPAALRRHLAEQRDEDVTVVKVFASYCPSCRGAAGPFRKVVAAYADEEVSFVKLDFAAGEDFAREALGVDNLPYFAVFRGTRKVNGASMGWRGLGSRLVDRIEAVRASASAA